MRVRTADVVVADPPRSGLGRRGVESIEATGNGDDVEPVAREQTRGCCSDSAGSTSDEDATRFSHASSVLRPARWLAGGTATTSGERESPTGHQCTGEPEQRHRVETSRRQRRFCR